MTNEELVKRYQAGDNSALDQLYRQNTGLIYAVMRRFKMLDFEKDDFYSEGCMALLDSARLFDLSRGNKFSTYVTRAIWGRMQRHIKLRIQRNQKPRQSMRDTWRYVSESEKSDVIEKEYIQLYDEEEIKRLKKCLKKLDKRSEYILLNRYNGEHLEQIGKKFGICKERVRQIEVASLKKLKEIHECT